MLKIILVTAIPDSTDANGITLAGNTITEVREFDTLPHLLAFIASHPAASVVAFQAYVK